MRLEALADTALTEADASPLSSRFHASLHPGIARALVREYVPGTCHGNAKKHAANQGGVEPSCPRLSHVSPLYSQFASVWT